MVSAISQGYAAVSTDGGHDGIGQTPQRALADSWALNSPGNVDLYALQNFASVAINDMTVLGKQLTEAYASGNCTGAPFTISTDWHRLFNQKNAGFDPYNYTQAGWDAAFHASVQQYTSMIGTADPNLSAFKQSGGKMITWHGMADQLIPFNGTVHYFSRVLSHNADATDFYRFFSAPGVGHCRGGSGAVPTDPLAQLVSWVEGGEAPQTLAANRTVEGRDWEQELCQYPLSSIYKAATRLLRRSTRASSTNTALCSNPNSLL